MKSNQQSTNLQRKEKENKCVALNIKALYNNGFFIDIDEEYKKSDKSINGLRKIVREHLKKAISEDNSIFPLIVALSVDIISDESEDNLDYKISKYMK
ncbi:MAG: hypothetical protein WA945_07280 [Arcobacteraceae bacterium]